MIYKKKVLLLNNIGLSYKGLKEYKKACKYFDNCIQFDKSYLSPYNNKAICKYNIGNIKEAISLLETVYIKNKQYINAIINLIQYYFDLEQFHKIKKIVNKNNLYLDNCKIQIFLTLIYYIKDNSNKFKEYIYIFTPHKI